MIHTQATLDTSIEFLKGVGPQRAEILNKELSIFSFRELLHHFPYRYVDRSKYHKVKEVISDQHMVQLKGVIDNIQTIGDKRRRRMTARFRDETGALELVWFKGIRWIEKTIKPGQEYVVFGKPNKYNGKINMPHPEVELVTQASQRPKGTFQPLYPSTEKTKAKGLDSKGLYKLIQNLFQKITAADIPESLPAYVVKKYRLISRWEAFKNIHLPATERLQQQALRRLKFEELFFLQLKILQLRQQRQDQATGFLFESLGHHFNDFYKHVLPYELTAAQKRVLKEIRQDTLRGKQMNRLLQGDVGSGKTIVAFMSMLMAADNGYQSCLMAPTEILAQQHMSSLTELAGTQDIRIELLTGSTKGAKRNKILEDLKNGDIDLLIGTHALIEDTVQYDHLGLVIIDEQHRFGVAQRARLWEKSKPNPPHVLVMTATPIPRTLSMTLYGDLDVSVIDELPPGRKPVTTVHMTDSDRLRIFGFMKKEIAAGRQVYVVYPLIKESEKLDFKDLEDGYESICRAFPMPDYTVSIVHGQMKAEDKEWEMQRFVKGETNIMVATTVIEVGVNVPNATVMVIESAERFGLAQLHQLRGRVGRGADQSYCVLVTKHQLSADARKRMKTMTATNDGFRIAEVDMDLRGPGAFDSTQQSGHVNFKVADIQQDLPILEEARKTAAQILEDDPALHKPEHTPLKQFIERKREPMNEWSRIL